MISPGINPSNDLTLAVLIQPSAETQAQAAAEAQIAKFITSAREMAYCPGHSFKAFGAPQEIPNNPGLQAVGAKRHHVSADGSCWARALWQCVFSQILDQGDDPYDDFIKKIASPGEVQGNQLTISENRVKETIYILDQLKDKTPEQRLDYLNQSEVDNSLVFFMREVAAEYMKYKWECSAADCLDIKTNKRRYGGPEITAFTNYFELTLHRIAQNSQGKWIYYDYDGKKMAGTSTPIANIAPGKIPHNCMFGANSAHYEFISFAAPAQPAEPEEAATTTFNLEASFLDLAKSVKAQIEDDHRLALRLQKELNEALEGSKTDLEATRRLNENYTLTIAREYGLDKSTLVAQDPCNVNLIHDETLVASGFFEVPLSTRALPTPDLVPSPHVSTIRQGNQTDDQGIFNEDALKIRQLLEKRKAKGTSFKAIDPQTKSISGGTCSAMSLNFIHEVFKFFEAPANEGKSIDPNNTVDAIKQMEKKHFTPSLWFRNIQAAFNTIILDTAHRVADVSRAKMESLSNYFALNICEASAEINVESETAEEDTNSVLGRLTDGVYVVRQILRADNEKGENYGHSCALIKAQHHLFFYDPNHGVRQIIHGTGKELFNCLNKAHRAWNVPIARLYRVERDAALLAENKSLSLPDTPENIVISASEPPVKVIEPASATTTAPTPENSEGFFASLFASIAIIFNRMMEFFRELFRTVEA